MEIGWLPPFVNSAAMNTYVHVFVWVLVSNLLRIYLAVELLLILSAVPISLSMIYVCRIYDDAVLKFLTLVICASFLIDKSWQ